MRWLVVVMVVVLATSTDSSMVRCSGNDGQETAEVVATEEFFLRAISVFCLLV